MKPKTHSLHDIPHLKFGEWIHVSDALPVFGLEVLVCGSEAGKTSALTRISSAKRDYYWDRPRGGGNIRYKEDIWYWMPMPQGPVRVE